MYHSYADLELKEMKMVTEVLKDILKMETSIF